jgi:hypothetical protein
MVLICNNNILTIEKWHENRSREKDEIKNIIINRKYNRENYKETPEKPKEINDSFIKSNEVIHIKYKNNQNLAGPV